MSEQTYYIARPEGWVHEKTGVLEVVQGVLRIGDYEVPAGLVPATSRKAAIAVLRLRTCCPREPRQSKPGSIGSATSAGFEQLEWMDQELGA